MIGRIDRGSPRMVVAGVVVAAAFAALRFAGSRSPAYQALAHLYVGAAFGAWLAGAGRAWGWIGLALTAAELAAFLAMPRH